MPGSAAAVRNSPTRLAAESRSSCDRPEPSTSRAPASGTRASASAVRAAAAPAAVVPRDPASAPSVLRSSSATKLSLSRFIVRTTAESGSDTSRASGKALPGAVRTPGFPATVTPRRSSTDLRSLAASSAVESAGQPRPRSTTRAERGGVSSPRKDVRQPGAVRTRSKRDSSPKTLPAMWRTPQLRTWAASEQGRARPGSGRHIPSGRGRLSRSLPPAAQWPRARCGSGSPGRGGRARHRPRPASRSRPARAPAMRSGRRRLDPCGGLTARTEVRQGSSPGAASARASLVPRGDAGVDSPHACVGDAIAAADEASAASAARADATRIVATSG